MTDGELESALVIAPSVCKGTDAIDATTDRGAEVVSRIVDSDADAVEGPKVAVRGNDVEAEIDTLGSRFNLEWHLRQIG